MNRPETDRNLLFGIIALQMDFITRDSLVAAMNAWALEKYRPLGEILVEREALDPADRALLEPMVDRHVAKHGGDPLASLAALSSSGGITTDLQRSVGDPKVLESLASIRTVPPEDPHATRSLETSAWSLSGTRFRKVRDHAKGGLGIVFVAQDEELHREVALKEIQDRHADDRDKRARFLMEAEITGGLEHPGIVPVYALGHYDDGRPFYAMRFIKGDSLKEAIGRFHADQGLADDPGQRVLALQKLLRRFLDVCNAVAYAHSRGILHRDLKPDNVMVGKYGETLVVDWGLAKIVGRSGEDNAGELPESTLVYTSPSGSAETLPGSVIGTPAYMSPEQATGRLDLLGPRSDVYSLGATLYSLLTGKAPFIDKDLLKVLSKVKRGEFTRPREWSPWLDPALEAICLKAMALRPDDRYATPQALGEDLERWLADEPVVAFPEPFTRRARRWARKHRTSLAITASAATVAALLLGGVTWLQIAQRDRVNASARTTLGQAEALAIKARATGVLADWERAVAGAVQAEARLDSGGGSRTVRQEVVTRLEGFRAELERRREALESDERDRKVVDDLEEARLRQTNIKDSRFDSDAKNEAYLAAFRAYGIDVATLPIDDAARRIRSSKVSHDLITALDDWAAYRSSNIPGERLDALARAAETDPVRAGIRDAIVRRDTAGLRQRIERPEDREKLGSRLRTVFQALIQYDPAASLALLETVRAEHPSDYWINHDLGTAYLNLQPQKTQEAALCLSVAVALRPNSPGSHFNLGLVLKEQGKLDQAIEAYRKALQIKPDLAEGYTGLGIAFQAQGKLDQALEAYRKAIQLKPDYAPAHADVGLVLQTQGKLDQAVESLLKAIQLKPDLADAHAYLGLVLLSQRKLDQAVEAYRRALQIKPDFAKVHNQLGFVLQAQGKLELAVEAFRKAIQIKPDFYEAHANLGLVLEAQGKSDQGIEAIRKAIQIKPDYAKAYYNLGLVFEARRELDQGIEALREAIRIDPDYAEAHYNLGIFLQAQGKTDQAVESYRKAIQFKPDYAEAFCNLGVLLGTMGRFREALEALERGHALGTKQPGWRYPSQEWVLQHRRFLDLDTRLPAILKGDTKPVDAAERIDLAAFCYKKGLHAASARLAAEAFEEKPELANDLQTGARYNAACSASLAGLGQGKDDPLPDEPARTKLREQALGWLKADLAAWTRILDGGNQPARKQAVAKTLAHWREDADLTGIRDEIALAKLSDSEREAFRAFWADVEALQKKAGQAGA